SPDKCFAGGPAPLTLLLVTPYVVLLDWEFGGIECSASLERVVASRAAERRRTCACCLGATVGAARRLLRLQPTSLARRPRHDSYDVRPFLLRAHGARRGAARGWQPGRRPRRCWLVLGQQSHVSVRGRGPTRTARAHPRTRGVARRRRQPGARPWTGACGCCSCWAPSTTRATQRALDRENQLHGDLVQGSFRDSYRNMTYKHVMTLKWAAYHCPGALYVLKTDDDVFVNSPELLRFLARELSPWGARRLILCVALPYSYVKRSWRSNRLYPPFCVGWAVLYSPDAVFLLYREAQRVPYFWIDDVHVTGTLAARVNLSQTPLLSLALTRLQMEALVDAPPGAAPPPYAAHFLFGSPDMHEDELYKLWDYVQQRRF
ncbi:Beta-1,3-galactosyltransferase brn, partial [Gryllus bimaculatus]